ncbi:MAG: hypothetical protein KBT68_12430, partial [bacterium]|nr:hypothetical protein [Candidatus Colisoma equi]
GGGLFVYDGDFSLENVSLEGKDRILKSGTGDLKVPAACAALPAVRVRSGALDAQDGVATAYTVNGALRIDGGATLKVDLVNGVCDSFAVTALDVSAASTGNRVFIDIPASVGYERVSGSHLLVSGAGLSESDAAKFKTVGMKGSFSVKNGDLYLDPPKGLFIVVQ